jgi:glyoxylase-like metal-dependent hydrolase (beta-lactamase superfamily II)
MQSSDENPTHENGTNGENRVQSIKFGHVNIYLIRTDSGHILVDVGMPKMEEQLDAAFENAGVDPHSVQLIVVTHGHLDHVGSITYAQQVTGGKILCHRSYSDDLVKGEAEPAVARSLKGHLLNFLTGLSGNKFEGTQPDILMEDEFDLNEYGISGKIIHTPGHSPSSISIVLGNGEALIGDLVRDEGSGKMGPGMFFEDRKVVKESLEKVAAFEPRRIYLSHGTYIDNRALRNAIGTI